MNHKKLNKNTKALSPVIAEIILIAVIFAGAVVIIAFAGSLTNQITQHPQQATITNITFTNNTAMNATVQNTGTDNVTIQTATINGNTANLAYTGNSTSLAVTEGDTGYFAITPTNSNTFQDGVQYTLTLTTAEGKTLDYAATYITNPQL
jgi:FlaG/FlaF family flagellin (archaellin)